MSDFQLNFLDLSLRTKTKKDKNANIELKPVT